MTRHGDDNILAAEYVFGLLTTDDNAAVDRRMAADAVFARLVEIWRARFSGFDDTSEQIAPGEELWSRIAHDLTISRPVQSAPRTPALQRFWSSIGALRVATIGSAFVAVLLAVAAVMSFQHARDVAARKPVYVAILVNDVTKQAGAVVNAFADGRVEMVPLTDIDVPEGRALQIWTLWDRSVGPRSVGLISRAQSVRLDLDKLPATSADQLFEITLEPAGGSPIGRPTGPILYKGTTSRAL